MTDTSEGRAAATALTINCEKCASGINVPLSLVRQLLTNRQFTCPKCKKVQLVAIRPTTIDALLLAIEQGAAGEDVLCMQRQHHMLNSKGALSPQLSQRSDSHLHAWDRQPDFQRRLPSGRRPAGSVRKAAPAVQQDSSDSESEQEEGERFQAYQPSKLQIGCAHPDPVVETASLAGVEPPAITYQLHLDDVVAEERLSGLQLEAVVYACQRHQTQLGDGSCAGFFIGDGAGVGKGRTIAGLILENWRCGRKRHLWVSIASDLKIDAARDLTDVGASEVQVHPLNKQPYAPLDSPRVDIQDGVIFLTYASLAASSDAGLSRLQQLVDWAGEEFDGLVVFDESHKAKNLVPEAGSKPTKVGAKVMELQQRLPKARVVYCSATGASEPRQLGYMVRLGLWGPGQPAFSDFQAFLDALGHRGVGALELVAMDMKAQGMYVCRTLSFEGAEFDMVHTQLTPEMTKQYGDATAMWSALRREFLHAIAQGEDAADGGKPARKAGQLWRMFWATHQRFFRHMCMAAKVPWLVQMAKEALAEGKCVVIGLQSTGEARTADVVSEKGEELDDFVSGPRELMLKLVREHYPLPAPVGGEVEGDDSTPCQPRKRRRESAADQDLQEQPSGRRKGSKASQAQAAHRKNGGTHSPGKACENGSLQPQASWPGLESAAAAPVEDSLARMRSDQMSAEAQQASQTARQRQAQVEKAVQGMELPSNPLDMLIDQLGGPEAVAEMTGRKGRLVRQQDGKGVRWEARNASGVAVGTMLDLINVQERQLFLDGTKLVAVISEAASAGISLHSDRRAVNQRRRVHLTLELPWSADKCLQQFGRSHRANQVHGPQYRLLFTPLGGERRFAAAVARRLETLGALTQGDRRAGPSLQGFHIDSIWGQRALKQVYAAIMEEDNPPVLPPACREQARPREQLGSYLSQCRAHLLDVGIIRPSSTVSAHDIALVVQQKSAPPQVGKVADADKVDVARFLNRLLGLAPAAQAIVFDFYQAVLEHTLAVARKEGRFDDGITSVTGTSVTLASEPQVIRRDGATGAATLLIRVTVDKGIGWEGAGQQWQTLRGAAAHSQPAEANGSSHPQQPGHADDASGYYRPISEAFGGRSLIMLAVLTGPAGSAEQQRYRIFRPCSGPAVKLLERGQLKSRYRHVSREEAQHLWQQAYSAAAYGATSKDAQARWKKIALIGGLVLPVWDVIQKSLGSMKRTSEQRLHVVRILTTGANSRRVVGVQIPEAALQAVLEGISGHDLPAQPSQPAPSQSLIGSSSGRNPHTSVGKAQGLTQHSQVKVPPPTRPAVKYFPFGSSYQAKAGRPPSAKPGPVDVIVID